MVSLCLSTQTAHAKIIYQSDTLSNGMEIVVIPNHRAPVVSHMVWYKVGAASEPAGKSGIAHFFEHLMFKETPTIEAGTFSKIIKQHGGNDNAFTSQDFTAYFQNIAKEHLPMVMRMEADRMQNLILTEDVIKAERDVVLEERRQRVDNNASTQFYERMNQALFPTHPYGIPVIGWKEEIEALNREDAMKFYRQYYAPNNAILVVAGDITLEELKPMAEKYYGSNRMSKIEPRTLPAAAQLKEAKRVDFKSPQAGTDTLHIAYRAPRGYDALEVVADLLGGNNTDYLYQELVIKDKVATHVEAGYRAVTMGPSSFNIYATPAPNVTIETLEKALHEKLTSIVYRGFSPEQIETSKKRLTYQSTYQADSLQGPAMRVGMAMTAGFDLKYVSEWEQRILKLRQSDIISAMQYVFTQSGSKPVIGTMRVEEKPEVAAPQAPALTTETTDVTQETLPDTPTKTAAELQEEAKAENTADDAQEIEDAAVIMATTIAIAEEEERHQEQVEIEDAAVIMATTIAIAEEEEKAASNATDEAIVSKPEQDQNTATETETETEAETEPTPDVETEPATKEDTPKIKTVPETSDQSDATDDMQEIQDAAIVIATTIAIAEEMERTDAEDKEAEDKEAEESAQKEETEKPSSENGTAETTKIIKSNGHQIVEVEVPALPQEKAHPKETETSKPAQEKSE